MSKSQSTQQRIAAEVRQAAEAKCLTRADLRRALGLTDWRPIQARWTGEYPYTTAELAILAELLGVTFTIPAQQ